MDDENVLQGELLQYYVNAPLLRSATGTAKQISITIFGVLQS